SGGVRRFLELAVRAASRVTQSDEALRRPRNRSVQQHVRIAKIPVMEEAPVRRDLVRFVADFQNAFVVLRPLMIAELASLRDSRRDVPGLEVRERRDV